MPRREESHREEETAVFVAGRLALRDLPLHGERRRQITGKKVCSKLPSQAEEA